MRKYSIKRENPAKGDGYLVYMDGHEYGRFSSVKDALAWCGKFESVFDHNQALYYDHETNEILSGAEILKIWNDLPDYAQDEYDGKFGAYLSACLDCNGGCLSKI
jgi:hypothetical protein